MTGSIHRRIVRSIPGLSPPPVAVLCLLVTWLAATPGEVRAEVREVVNVQNYPVAVGPDESLTAALARATPVRPRWWQRFHARAVWNLAWTYRQVVDAGGRCEAAEVVVDVVTDITLPDLVQATDEQRRAFQPYRDALKVHEQGHHAIAVEAGQRVLAAIRDAGAWPDCAALDAQVGRLTERIIAEAKSAEQRYDADTGYGRTQGARLER